MAAADLTAARLRELLHYEPETGAMTWKVARQRVRIGSPAGAPNYAGYLVVVVDGVQHRVHRLAWLHQTGQWPIHTIDHINGVRADNRFNNLRDVPTRTNNENQRSARGTHKATRSLGVSWRADCKKWFARIQIEGVEHPLGLFDRETEARDAYILAKRKLHAGCSI